MSESGTTKNNSNVHVSETKPIHNRQSKRKRNTYTRPGKNPTNLLHSNQSCDTNCSNEMKFLNYSVNSIKLERTFACRIC
ncbi:hypothetical protein RIR_jg29635.t1 [Rhizophagus irregularis DAOM 181602=DAOM 197198]|nr:hypothetical protein RIR_jg29635.t1 [Rhizophagus irregularis DAOM 181602=DAOM 197198]